MVPVKYKIETFNAQKNKTKHFLLRRFKTKDVDRIFMAWNNPQSYRYNSIDWNKQSVNQIIGYSWPSTYGMYFMVLEDLETNQIVATCRFGEDKSNPKELVWDFGYTTFRSDDKTNYSIEDIRNAFYSGVKTDNLCWGKGYCSIILSAIIKFAQNEGVTKLISGADGMNWGSQKVMMKNGMTFYEIDDDGDVSFILYLKDKSGNLIDVKKPTKEELSPIWDSHMNMVKNVHKKPEISTIIKKNEIEHFGNSLLFFLLNRASGLLELNNNKAQSQEQINLLKSDICKNYLNFKETEKVLFKEKYVAFKNRWQNRIGNNSFDPKDVEFNLNCCNILENELKKLS